MLIRRICLAMHSCNPTTRRLKQEGCVWEASPDYIESFRLVSLSLLPSEALSHKPVLDRTPQPVKGIVYTRMAARICSPASMEREENRFSQVAPCHADNCAQTVPRTHTAHTFKNSKERPQTHPLNTDSVR